MQLLYIWIEEFRNLKSLGFNFSTEVEFVYDKDANLLTLAEKPISREGFFGEQIQNVTAIIGKNGAGKSNILELICYLSKGNTKRYRKYIIIYAQDGQKADSGYYYKTNILGLSPKGPYHYLPPDKSIPDLSIIFFSNVSDGREHRFSRQIIDVSQNGSPRYINRKGDIFNQVKFLLSDYFEQAILPRPTSLLLSARIEQLKKGLLSRLEKHKKAATVLERYKNLSSGRYKDGALMRFQFRYAIFIYALNQIFIKNYEDNASEGGNHFFETIETSFDRNFDLQEGMAMSSLHDQTNRFLQDLIFNFNVLGKINKNSLGRLLSFDSMIERLNPEINEEKISKKIYFKLWFDQHNQNIFREFEEVFEYPELIDVEWAGISSGHKAFMNLYAQFHASIRRVAQQRNVLICIDEGDLYLHPEWQREFLDRLVRFIPTIFRKDLQFVLTTHSPFLISDLPKENLILVQNDAMDYCRIISDEKLPGNTFGANIYDLFKGPFVLEESTISAFALRKVKTVIEYLLKDKPTRYELAEAKQVIEVLGDKPVHFKLSQMYQDAETRL